MKKINVLLIALICGVPTVAWGQQNPFAPVQGKWETVGKNVELNYHNSDYCDYYLLSSRNKELWLRTGNNNLLRIPKEHAAKYRNDPSFLPSTFITFKGYFPDKLNPDFLYSLPVKTGDSVQYQIDIKKHSLTYLFTMNALDTVYAVRGGVVCKNNDQGLLDKEKTLETKGALLIYHADCTFALYDNLLLKFVREGENIKVGQPVGILSTKKPLSIAFFFLDKNKFADGNRRGVPHSHFNPIFHTTTGNIKLKENITYTNEWSDELITQEMSKAEKKKYEKEKLKP